MGFTDCDEVIAHVDRVDDTAPHAEALVAGQVEHGAGVASDCVHFDELRDIVVISGGYTEA
jgi:hypothetical protein